MSLTTPLKKTSPKTSRQKTNDNKKGKVTPHQKQVYIIKSKQTNKTLNREFIKLPSLSPKKKNLP